MGLLLNGKIELLFTQNFIISLIKQNIVIYCTFVLCDYVWKNTLPICSLQNREEIEMYFPIHMYVLFTCLWMACYIRLCWVWTRLSQLVNKYHIMLVTCQCAFSPSLKANLWHSIVFVPKLFGIQDAKISSYMCISAQWETSTQVFWITIVNN